MIDYTMDMALSMFDECQNGFELLVVLHAIANGQPVHPEDLRF